MKEKHTKFLFIIFLATLSLSGCSPVSPQGDIFIEEELGAYAFGPLVDVDMDELIQFEYDGEEIRIPYHVEGHAPGIVSELGWFLFVGGLPQPTRLETTEGEIFRETAYMHNFALEFMERIEFYVVFTPVSGILGERVGMIAGALLRPDFIPESIQRPAFGIFHALTATIPAEILMNSGAQSTWIEYSDFRLDPISENIIIDEEVYLYTNESLEELLVQFPRIGLSPSEGELQLNYEEVIFAHDGQVMLRFFVYGGQEVTNRITFFVNHQPVQINDADFIEVSMEHGKMAIIDVAFSLEDDASHFNSLYAIMITGGDAQMQDIFKTRTLLLVNE